MQTQMDRFTNFVENTNPIVRVSIKLLLILLLGIGHLVLSADKLFTKLASIAGTVIVFLSIVAFIFWIFGSEASIKSILVWYGVGQGFKFIIWLPKAMKSRGKRR